MSIWQEARGGWRRGWRRTHEVEESDQGPNDDRAVLHEAERDDGAFGILEVPEGEDRDEGDADDEHGDDRAW